MSKSASQYKARTNFLLEHLASFTMKSNQEAQIPAKERLAETKEMLAKGTLWTKEMEMRLTDNDIVLLDGETQHLASFTMKSNQEAQIPAKERLAETKEMLAKGTLWTKEMEMRLTDNDIVLLDGETQDVIEVYPLSSISVVQHINEDSDLNSVLLFTTQQTDEKYAATHLFQSDRVPAAVVATEIMKASSSKGAMPSRSTPSKGGASLPPPPAYTAPQPPTLERERMDLYEKSLVAQTIAAFSAASTDKYEKRPVKAAKVSDSESTSDDTIPVDILEARTNRDVQILNHCIDDIENLVQQTKKSAEAWKKLQKKKGKIKPDNPLAIEAKPPPESDFIDAFQKFKHAFNLLGRLRPYLHHPNAAELVHYLFVPLSLLVRCTNGPEKARGVLSPLLSLQAIELLQNCLSSKEMELWSALGPNWTEAKQSKPFKDVFIPPYAPVFKDGWVPPEFIGGQNVPANVAAAVAANAAAVAQMNDSKKLDDPTSPTVLAAAAKFRRLTSIKKETAASSPAPKNNIFRRGHVMYDFTARNSKELTIKQGEEISILDDSRQWWCVRNSKGEIGFIPNTIIEVKMGQEAQHNNVISPLPSPPMTAPPLVPTATITNIELREVKSTETSTVRQEEERKVPFVELRPVNKKPEEEPTPPPPPPMSPPPPTPPPVSTTPETTIVKKTVTKTENHGNALELAVLSGGNLKKVDKEALKKNREENQVKRMSSADLLNDELKRRMTHGQSALTPGVVRKKEQEEVIVLTPESGPTEVRDWLKSKNFSQTCIKALAWNSAKDLDKMSKEDLKRKCGDAEGARVYSQFAVQKSKWTTSSKGNELQFIMKKRKEIVDVTAKDEDKQPQEEGNLRNIVAEARASTETEVVVTQENKRSSYSGSKPIMITAPQERQRPQSMIIETKKDAPTPPERARSTTVTSSPTRRKSRGMSFGNDMIIPPPPVDYNDNEKVILTPDQVEAILAEQKKQQELLMEHEKQFALLERMQMQKRELEEHKRDYEELQKRKKQDELEEKQKELEKQIKAQQQELKANETRIQQQNQYFATIPGMTSMPGMMMPPRQVPVMSPQVQMVPVSGLPPQPTYLPMQPMPTVQPVVGYAPTVAQPGMPQMVGSIPSYIPQ
ncbi:epidermal growth factor receptor kinase substrate 8 [Exaiptasia diaphana]|uniref:Epidermal growth factor receptor kinase substrate 8 n=1 Tax=Exaiptasia diaphana TaxID=2652724 RepID=A0A913XRS8_EXADI|nr:epidermal growth factor receptor kinase substrate 8 [Exaiptasia diaphana]